MISLPANSKDEGYPANHIHPSPFISNPPGRLNSIPPDAQDKRRRPWYPTTDEYIPVQLISSGSRKV